MCIRDRDTAVGTITSSWGSVAAWWPVFLGVIALLIIGGVIFVWAFSKKARGSWNLTFRVYQENKQHNTIYMDPVIIKGKRVMLSNGLRLIYLQQEILGKKLFPNLNHYTRPGVYDLLISADNRIFIIDGISGIDEQRKQLQVGIRYPGIDYSLEEVNRDHAKLNSMDRRSDLLGIVKAASIAVVAIVLLIALIIGGKYWIEGKEIDNQQDQVQLQLLTGLEDYQLRQNENTAAITLLVKELKDLTGNVNLRPTTVV
jgi:hypothetical protein